MSTPLSALSLKIEWLKRYLLLAEARGELDVELEEVKAGAPWKAGAPAPGWVKRGPDGKFGGGGASSTAADGQPADPNTENLDILSDSINHYRDLMKSVDSVDLGNTPRAKEIRQELRISIESAVLDIANDMLGESKQVTDAAKQKDYEERRDKDPLIAKLQKEKAASASHRKMVADAAILVAGTVATLASQMVAHAKDPSAGPQWMVEGDKDYQAVKKTTKDAISWATNATVSAVSGFMSDRIHEYKDAVAANNKQAKATFDKYKQSKSSAPEKSEIPSTQIKVGSINEISSFVAKTKAAIRKNKPTNPEAIDQSLANPESKKFASSELNQMFG